VTLLALLCISPAACADASPATTRFTALLRARTASGEPIAGVRAWADGRALGATSATGELRTDLIGAEGSAVQLSAACPPAYRTPDAERRLVLRRVRAARGSAGSADLELAQLCEPIEHAAALVVLASGEGRAALPIRIDGELVGQTEADGSAHLTLTAPAHATVRVELETSAQPRLLPRNPVHSFRLEDEDSILLLEQTFSVERPRRVPAAPGRTRSAPPRPQRIE
jgi:hypothetical protein